MKINYARASSLGSYDSCQFQYYLDYSLGLGSKAGKKALLGTISHLALELLAKVKKTGHHKLNDKYSNIYYLLNIAWDRNVKENPQFEYTQADYDFCVEMVEIVLKTKYNPLLLHVIATEKQFEIEMNVPGFGKQPFYLRGTIDLITEIDKDTLHVIDWKTGERKSWSTGKLKELEDFQKDIQLRLYDLALSVIYPQYKKRMFTIYFVRSGGPYTVSFSDAERKQTLDILRRYYNKIATNEMPDRLKDDGTKRDQTWKCKYVCHYGKTIAKNGKPLCDVYYGVLKNEGLEAAGKKIVALSIEGQPVDPPSRRNNFANPKLFKGKLIS